MTLLRVSMCVHAVDEDLVAVVDLGIILLGLDSGYVHDPPLCNKAGHYIFSLWFLLLLLLLLLSSFFLA